MMQNEMGQELSVDDLARVALFSKFHFTRVFQRITGVSPRRFLTALRMAEAKRLLSTTGRTVADIATSVGYTSVSTFSARFNRSVGVTPMAYRRNIPVALERATGIHPHPLAVRGQVVAETPGPVFVGLFPEPIAEGHPATWTIAGAPGPYRMTGVRPGTWHLVAYPLATGERAASSGARSGPITIDSHAADVVVDLALRTLRPTDPPPVLSMQRLGHQLLRRPELVA